MPMRRKRVRQPRLAEAMGGIKRIGSGGIFEAEAGYCRAVVAGGWVHVSGTVAPGDDIPGDVLGQAKAAIEVIGTALGKAGADFSRVVRVTYVLPNPDDFKPCWPLMRDTFGANPPAAMMISSPLIDPRYLIEIEVTAFIGEPD